MTTEIERLKKEKREFKKKTLTRSQLKKVSNDSVCGRYKKDDVEYFLKNRKIPIQKKLL
jgi:hypothetical protein